MALCEDTSKLRTPLNEVCISTDIGCVPLVEGKPECSPQPDQIPLAFDQSTSTLWIFNCSTREWIPFKKFTMCELQSVNLDNIKNICDLLNIGVYYDPGTGCQQGSISLGELAEKILDCIKLETKALAVTSSGDKLKIWVEGLDNLPPFYVKGTNIWTEGGSGTEADPLKVVTYDPICKWPTKTQGQVDAAQTKHLGACLDGEMSRVPFPPKVCELPERNQAQVDASNNKKLIACVNGEGVKVPFPKQPCEFPEVTVEQVEAAADKDFIVCVDGQNSKVGIPDGLLTPICENPQITGSQARSKKNLRLLACDGGNVVLFPLPDEMFQGSYMCVPYLEAPPSGAPAEGTGPIRVDCNDNVWFWICGENRWYQVDIGNHDHPSWDTVKNAIADHCGNIRFHGWSEQDNCFTDFEITPQQLSNLLAECWPVTNIEEVENNNSYTTVVVNNEVKKLPWGTCIYPEISWNDFNRSGSKQLIVCADGKNRKVSYQSEPTIIHGIKSKQRGNVFGCVNMNVNAGGVVYSSMVGQLIYGDMIGGNVENPDFATNPWQPRVSMAQLTVTNPFVSRSLVEITAKIGLSTTVGSISNLRGGQAAMFVFVNQDKTEGVIPSIMNAQATSNKTAQQVANQIARRAASVAAAKSEYDRLAKNYSNVLSNRHTALAWSPNVVFQNDPDGAITFLIGKASAQTILFYNRIDPGETKVYYVHYYLCFEALSSKVVAFHPYCQVEAVIHRHVKGIKYREYLVDDTDKDEEEDEEGVVTPPSGWGD